MKRLLMAGSVLLALAGCGEQTIDPQSQLGPNPQLPEPRQALLPAMRIAEVVGWKQGETPTVAGGLAIRQVATGLSNPRNVLGLPNGDILVVESRKEGAEPVTRPKSIIVGLVMSKAHGDKGKPPPSNRVTLLRDADGDGTPELKTILVEGLNAPFGIVYADNGLYVANTDAIVRYPFTPGQTRITAPGQVLTELPAGEINHHWTKSLTASADGSLLYVGIGSNSNAMENGADAEQDRAMIWEVDRATGRHRVYATGLRNPNGLTVYPGSNTLWAVINERDELGPDLVPDYLTSVRPGAFYGWPYSYYGRHLDPRVKPQRPDLVARAVSPDYSLGSHVAPLGLAFGAGGSLGNRFSGGAFVGEHGSWNRDHYAGYKVVFIPFQAGRPAGKPQDVVTGFLNADGQARGRPVGLALDRTGALLIADDVGNSVWRVTASGR